MEQVTTSLDEERIRAQEFDGERDEFGEQRLQAETRLRGKLDDA